VSPDAAQLEVIRQATIAVAEEMKFDLMRTARSPVLREAGDLSCAITDAAGRTVAQGQDIPMHLGVLSFTVQRFLETVPPSALEPGDVYFTNLPACGGNHLPDVKAVRPVFVDGALWRARLTWPGEHAELNAGDPVVVERVKGLTLCVRKADRWELEA
jgi:N-methylhydantoinase B